MNSKRDDRVMIVDKNELSDICFEEPADRREVHSSVYHVHMNRSVG